MDYYIMQESVSRERLQQLHIRHSAIELENEAVQEVLGEALACWVVTATGLEKLTNYGYEVQHSVEFETGDDVRPTGVFVALVNPDQTPASTEVDPAEIKVVYFSADVPTSLRDRLRQAAEELLIPVFRRHVRFTYNGSPMVVSASSDPGVLQVVLGGSSIGGSMDLPSVMWDNQVHLHGEHAAIAPYMIGSAIMTDEDFEVASLGENDLFIYPDLIYHIPNGAPRNMTVLRRIFSAAAELHTSPRGADYDVIEERYVNACSQRVKNEVRRIKDDLDNTNNAARETQSRLVSLLRDHQRLTNELSNYSNDADAAAVKLRKEFRALLGVPRVVEVEWRGQFMCVTTDKLYTIDPRTGHEHEIGAFKLIINHLTSDVEFHNITRRVRGYEAGMNAPHVFPTGRACLGSMQETIPMLVAGYEWAVLVQICIAFLESVNTDDSAGRYVNRWPRSRSKEQIEAGEPRRGEPLECQEAADDYDDEPETDDEYEDDYDEAPDEENTEAMF